MISRSVGLEKRRALERLAEPLPRGSEEKKKSGRMSKLLHKQAVTGTYVAPCLHSMHFVDTWLQTRSRKTEHPAYM